MGELGTGVVDALRLLMSGDRYLWSIVLLSLYVSVVALVISAVIGIPLGAWVGLRSFTGRRFVTTLIYTGMGLPPVVVGLVVYLGTLEKLCSPQGGCRREDVHKPFA